MKKSNSQQLLFDQSLILKKARILDPLGLNEGLRLLPEWNITKDTNKIAVLLEVKATLALQIKNEDIASGIAGLRDLGMLASSLRRHGIEPCEIDPVVGSSLLYLASITKTVPRDTVYTYGPANPGGHEMRTFTSLVEERVFVSSFNYGMSSLDDCINSLLAVLEETALSRASAIKKAEAAFEKMIEAISVVRKEISPEIFTGELRPYFDPFEVDDQTFLAPGGAQMPVILIDLLLWGSDFKLEGYSAYLEENSPYCLEGYRNLIHLYQGQPSLVTRASLYAHEERSALKSLCQKVFNFRKMHLNLAKANFALRKDTDKGSGGYRPDILEHLLELTKQALITLENRS